MRAPRAFGRSSDRLVITFGARQTIDHRIRAVVIRRASRAKHLPDAETRAAGDEMVDGHAITDRLKTRVDQRQFRRD